MTGPGTASGGGGVQAVVFGLGKETFALPVGQVREILDHREAFGMPNGPDWLLGLTDVRGEAVPMVDLRVRLGLAPTTASLATRILVVDVPLADRVVALGLVVDRVLEVSSFGDSDVDATPDIGVRWRSEYIRGVVRHGGEFVVLLDLAGIFSSADADSAEFAVDQAA